MRITVRVEMVPDERVVVEHLLRGSNLDHVTQVSLFLARVVARRQVLVYAHVTVVLVRPAELVHELRYITCQSINQSTNLSIYQSFIFNWSAPVFESTYFTYFLDFKNMSFYVFLKWCINQCSRVRILFISKIKKHDFLRFFYLLHTFSQTLVRT